MTKHPKQQTSRCRRRPVQRHVCMSSDTGKERPGPLSFEMPFAEFLCGLNGLDAEAHHHQRMPGYTYYRRENLWNQLSRVTDKRGENFCIRTRVRAERRRGSFQRSLENGGCAVVERVSKGRGRVNPFKTM